MGGCFSFHRKKKVMTAGYTGTQATEEPQKVEAYGAEAYELVGQLGSGRHGTMKLMRNKKTKEMVAVKHVEREAGAGLSKNTEREIINHRKLLHESIIKFHEVYVTDDHLAIVMEYASGGTLAQRIKEQGPMTEEAAKQLFIQLLAGMAYCHSLGVFHRDLRMENLLLDGSHFQPRIKITGFGYSKSAVLDSQPKTNVGSPSYCPPELLLNTRDDGAVYDGSSNDIWSAGVILYYMLCAVLPFEDPANPGALNRKMMQKIVNVEYSYPPNIQPSPEFKDFLARIFTKDPTTRIKIPEMSQHPWLVGSKLPEKEEGPAKQSPQTEVEIHQIVEKARRRRQQQQERRRSTGGDPAGNGRLSRAASGRTSRASSGVLPHGVGAVQSNTQDNRENGIAEVKR